MGCGLLSVMGWTRRIQVFRSVASSFMLPRLVFKTVHVLAAISVLALIPAVAFQ